MTTETLSAIIGAFMPIVVDFIRKFAPNKRWVSYTISLLVSVVVGALSSYFSGKLSLKDIDAVFSSIATAAIASQTVYNLYFRDSKLAKLINK